MRSFARPVAAITVLSLVPSIAFAMWDHQPAPQTEHPHRVAYANTCPSALVALVSSKGCVGGVHLVTRQELIARRSAPLRVATAEPLTAAAR